MAAKYRVGIIGRTGKGDYGHGIDVVWKDVPQVEVVAVADEHAGGRAQAAQKTGAQHAYADYREMLDKEDLNIVAVASRWLDQHRDMVVGAAEHACHVYMEKPFCRTLEEADEMVLALEMRHLKLAIAHTTRYAPVLPTVHKLIKDGEIGDVLEVRARGKEDSKRGGGEDLWVLGSHMLDLMRTFTGDVETCYATVKVDGRPVTQSDVSEGNEGIGPLAGDSINAMYTFQGNNITGYFGSHRDRAGQPPRFGLQVFGSKGIIEMLSGPVHTCQLLKDPAWSPGRSGAKWLPVSAAGIGKPGSDDGHQSGNLSAVLDLIDAIEKDRQPISSMYDARAATEMIVGIFESHRARGPVSFPLTNRKNPLTMLS
ncbi:MAG: Gfo/Idh/MocA family oxidoreductase [Planctomycetaceae bacterium]